MCETLSKRYCVSAPICRVIVNVFMDPMRKKKIVSEDLIMAIFGNVRVLLNINKQLLEALYVAVKHDSGCPDYANANLGAVILRFCPFFKMYVISSAAVPSLGIRITASSRTRRSRSSASSRRPRSSPISTRIAARTPPVAAWR